jgi:hypothetical protein
VKRGPHEFAWLIESINRQGVIPLLVAGQAVNAWASIFLSWDIAYNLAIRPDLTSLQPHTSLDMELMKVGTAELESAGEVTYRHVNDPFHRVAPAEHSTWTFRGPDGSDVQVQVMDRVLGTNSAELLRWSTRVSIGENAVVELPDPIALLPAKTANFVQLDQKGRQDMRHCQMLACCVHAFLGSIAQNDAIPSRTLLKHLQRFDAFSRSRNARLVSERCEIDWEKCYPIRQLQERATIDEKIRNWVAHHPSMTNRLRQE